MPERPLKSHPLEGGTIKYLTQAQVRALFSVIGDKRDLAIFATIYYFGLRVKEVTLIRLDDVDFDQNRIYIRRIQGGISEEKSLTGMFKDVRRLLQDYIENHRIPNSTRLFTGREGGLKESRVRGLFYQYAKQAHLNGFSVRSLRHSIAMHLLEAGGDIEYVRGHLGRRSIQGTLAFAQITERRREEVAKQLERSPKIVRLDGLLKRADF